MVVQTIRAIKRCDIDPTDCDVRREYYSLMEAVDATGASAATVLRTIDRMHLPAHRNNHRVWRIPRQTILTVRQYKERRVEHVYDPCSSAPPAPTRDLVKAARDKLGQCTEAGFWRRFWTIEGNIPSHIPWFAMALGYMTVTVGEYHEAQSQRCAWTDFLPELELRRLARKWGLPV